MTTESGRRKLQIALASDKVLVVTIESLTTHLDINGERCYSWLNSSDTWPDNYKIIASALQGLANG